MSVPDNLSAYLASELGRVTGFASGLALRTALYKDSLPAILVSRTKDRREELEWSHTFGNLDGRPNLYSAVLLLARFVEGADYSAVLDQRDAAIAAIQRYLWTFPGIRLHNGTEPLCQKAGSPLEIDNDRQGPVIRYILASYIGAFITIGVYEMPVTF